VDRHLLPHEYDLLLDGDSGFGLAPLQAHVRGCEACRAELEAARAVMAELDDLPHLAPSPVFADRVLSQVEIFEPWHVALGDTARGLVPASRPARVLAAAGGLSLATVLSLAVVWLVSRLDVLALSTGLVAERSRAALGTLLGELGRDLFGEAAGASPALLLLAVGVFAAVAVAATAGLRVAVARNAPSGAGAGER
jgi:hypothetical protein